MATTQSVAGTKAEEGESGTDIIDEQQEKTDRLTEARNQKVNDIPNLEAQLRVILEKLDLNADHPKKIEQYVKDLCRYFETQNLSHDNTLKILEGVHEERLEFMKQLIQDLKIERDEAREELAISQSAHTQTIIDARSEQEKAVSQAVEKERKLGEERYEVDRERQGDLHDEARARMVTIHKEEIGRLQREKKLVEDEHQVEKDRAKRVQAHYEELLEAGDARSIAFQKQLLKIRCELDEYKKREAMRKAKLETDDNFRGFSVQPPEEPVSQNPPDVEVVRQVEVPRGTPTDSTANIPLLEESLD